ncbi:hypothetical protein OROGR_001501 [Orobanche gracilis]
MASAKTAICFSLALFATASILSTANASVLSTAAFNPFCRNADDPNLCAHLANGASTWAEAMTNTLQSVLDKVKVGKKIAYRVKSKLPANFRPQTKESIAATCRYAYDNVLYNIEPGPALSTCGVCDRIGPVSFRGPKFFMGPFSSLRTGPLKSTDRPCIEQCIEFVKSDPYSSLDTYLSAATFTECTDGLQEFGVNLPEVAAFDKDIRKLSSVLLAVAQLKKA